MERVAVGAASGASSRALTILALFLALLFRAFPSAPVSVPLPLDAGAACERPLGTERGEHEERTEPLANKPAATSRRNELHDDDLLGDAPAVTLAAASRPDLQRSPADLGGHPRGRSHEPLRSRETEPRTSRGPPARG